jgi:hypothetical protein
MSKRLNQAIEKYSIVLFVLLIMINSPNNNYIFNFLINNLLFSVQFCGTSTSEPNKENVSPSLTLSVSEPTFL